ncbi:hypothetical protein PanWU01x14_118980 [Parasponia andersonii]|uniref:DUF538 domain-containing protein n=1 Tax=Parasponia andersonii TaxID=3476 RepID=A0A2P5CVW2_PARAD|nr:hypothetical protein PanWU01x14_118980 [Parasponia andersonii]
MASAVAPISLSLILLALFSLTHFSSSLRVLRFNSDRRFTANLSTSDVHDLLPLYGLPRGLLPNNVKSYSLSEDGSFKVELQSPCYVQFDKLVWYDKEITGKLSYGSVSDVTGIQAKKLFLWVSVTEIHADKDSDTIRFYVGFLSEDLPAEEFEKVPVCKGNGCQETKPESI